MVWPGLGRVDETGDGSLRLGQVVCIVMKSSSPNRCSPIPSNRNNSVGSTPCRAPSRHKIRGSHQRRAIQKNKGAGCVGDACQNSASQDPRQRQSLRP